MAEFRKKPVVINAVRWMGDNWDEVMAMIIVADQVDVVANDALAIDVREGVMLANVGDWIIKGVNGELYPCKHDVFKETYERVEV